MARVALLKCALAHCQLFGGGWSQWRRLVIRGERSGKGQRCCDADKAYQPHWPTVTSISLSVPDSGR